MHNESMAELIADDSLIELARRSVEWHADQIASMFLNPKVTILIRNPDVQDGDLVVTQDDFPSVIQALQGFQEKELARTVTVVPVTHKRKKTPRGGLTSPAPGAQPTEG